MTFFKIIEKVSAARTGNEPPRSAGVTRPLQGRADNEKPNLFDKLVFKHAVF
jgi:hypothetical protein